MLYCVCVCVCVEQYPTEEDMIEWAKRESEREERERVARLTQQEQEDLELAIALSKSEFSWPELASIHTAEDLRVLGFHNPTSFSTVQICPHPPSFSSTTCQYVISFHVARTSSEKCGFGGALV